MKRFSLFVVLIFIVLGFAQQPAPVLAQTTGCESAPAEFLPSYRTGWDIIVGVTNEDPRPNMLRSWHSTTSSVVIRMPMGNQMVLLGNAECSGGYRWYPVAIISGGVTYTGWTVDGLGAVHYLELISEVDLSITPTATPRATRTPIVTPVPATPGATRTPIATPGSGLPNSLRCEC